MQITYLYVKTHRKTGLKYLGKTKSTDPHSYKGSGGIWKSHIKEFGYDVETVILRECHSNQEVNEWGRHYSELWNIVESEEWANQIPETGGGGSYSEQSRKNISEKLKGRKKPPRTKIHTERQAATIRGKPNPKTSAGLRAYHNSNPDRSEIIQKQSEGLKKWYKENEKLSSEKALKTWYCRYLKDYEKYRTAIRYIGKGFSTIAITKIMKIDYGTVEKLRDPGHRIYSLFPELVELMCPVDSACS